MVQNIFSFTKYNYLIWVNAAFLIVLLLLDKADALTIVFAYFLETIIIGILHVIKLWLCVKYGKSDSSENQNGVSGYGIIPFFMIHYGMFVAIQSIFAFSFFDSKIPEIKSGFNLIENYSYLLSQEGIQIIVASLFITNLSYFYNNFLIHKKYQDYKPSSLLFKPYGRIFIQQFVVILAGFFFVLTAADMAAAILLIGFRLIIDLSIVSIRKDSKPFESFVKKHSNSYEHYLKMKEEYQKYSE
ncbi:DUF6498-containing protein [Patiriisocius hiemis]|uniref:DUF6498-containing protein n=1 Tax=Patiriisocius hiemis TaxID=3075604 RepID=A0ABU2YEQ0_9FLAO|nr:DUF6498-containing protein [Constantimarinum sp. W242]MDT0556124.1 DUF6498-containing protein [Constantimarinum sp. W242]